MPSKRHKPEEIVAKLRQVDVLTSQGQTVANAVRAIGVTEVTHYRWRQEYGGLKSVQVRRMKDLELEPAAAQGGCGSDARQADPGGGRPGKLLGPARRRACVEHIRAKLAISERRTCRALGQHRSTRAARCRGAETMRSGSRPTSSRLRASTAAMATARSPPSCMRQAGW